MNKFKVTIEWGSENFKLDTGENPDGTYSFETNKELEAFLWGVDESSGYFDYNIVEEEEEGEENDS